jgi:tetratricopeptide (TPR) repeat protein
MQVLFSTLGSIIVSSSIVQNNQVPYSSLMYLSLGLDSDVTSGRLKLASVFYCVGDMDRTEFILRQTESRYNPDVVEAVCSCWSYPLKSLLSAEFKRKRCEQNENCIFDIVSFCVRFLQIEVNCVPRELQYEMMRSTRDDMLHRSLIDSQWINYAVVDSLSYLYFLQYKTYGKLHRYQDRQRALNNLLKIIVQGGNFGHRETTLNLLGQCMEQENKYNDALQCYMLSIQQRERNNAAKIHICRLLAKCLPKVKD